MSGCTLTRLAGRGGIDVTGSERIRWLDGMVTQDVAALAVGAVAPCLALTHQGRIVADAWLWMFEDRVHLDCERAAAGPLCDHLERLVIADDVALTDTSAGSARFSLEGEGAWDAVVAALGAPPDAALVRVPFAGGSAVLAPHGLVSAAGVQLRVPAASADALEGTLLAAPGVAPENAEAFEQRRVAAGVPWYGRELDQTVLPAEARLERAISTTKGCYAGQEVVARMRSRGRVSSLLVSLAFEDDAVPPPGSALSVEGKKVGEVTSALRHPRHGAIGLGYVKASRAIPGTRVRVDGTHATLSEPGATADA